MKVTSTQLGSQLSEDEFSYYRALGGIRGIAEATAPGLAFILVFISTSSLWWSAVIAVVMGAFEAGLRLFTRSSLTQVFTGFGGVLISALWAWNSGRGSDFFALGLITNLVVALVFLGAILVNRDPIGVAVASVEKLPAQWRQQQKYRKLNTACKKSSYLWVIMCGIRLLIQTPLWWYGSVVWLGVARLLMGVPLFALIAWVAWGLIKSALNELKTDSSYSDPSASVSSAS